jgi:hypothetical protein
MARILRGKNKGNIIKLYQWGNDWFLTADGKVYSPGSIQLDADEVRDFLLSDPGIMLSLYSLEIPSGKFKKIRQRRFHEKNNNSLG